MLGGAGFLPSTVPSNHPPKTEQAYMALWWRDSWIKMMKVGVFFSDTFHETDRFWPLKIGQNCTSKKEMIFSLQPSFFRGETSIFFLWRGGLIHDFQTTHFGEEKRVVISNPSPFLRVGGILEKLTDGFIWSFLGWLCKKRPLNPPKKTGKHVWVSPAKKGKGWVVFLFKESFGWFFFGLPETNIFFGFWKSNQLEIVGRRFIQGAPLPVINEITPPISRFITPVTHL